MTNLKILVLEDDPNRQEQFKKRFEEKGNISYTIVENAKDCNILLEKNQYDIVMLDHDLGGETFVSSENENTGAEVSRWIRDNYKKIKGNPYFLVHSLNYSGAKYIENNIKIRFKNIKSIPFVWTEKEFKRISF